MILQDATALHFMDGTLLRTAVAMWPLSLAAIASFGEYMERNYFSVDPSM
jgi:hypothetical protein